MGYPRGLLCKREELFIWTLQLSAICSKYTRCIWVIARRSGTFWHKLCRQLRSEEPECSVWLHAYVQSDNHQRIPFRLHAIQCPSHAERSGDASCCGRWNTES